MRKNIGTEKLAEVVRKINSQYKLIRVLQLKGGVSARVLALEIKQANGQKMKMVMRQYGDADLKHDPDIAIHECSILKILRSEGLLVPEVYLTDQSNTLFPKPYIVIEHLEGEIPKTLPDLTGYIYQLALCLVKVHSIVNPKTRLPFLCDKAKEVTEILNSKPRHVDNPLESDIRKVLTQLWPPPAQNKSTLLHGDFWPGNTLWKDNKLVTIIDWEDAGMGDPLSDIANCRLELLWAFGVDAMNNFTDMYISLSNIDFTNMSIWDLVASLCSINKITKWNLNCATEKKMRGDLKFFTTQALEMLQQL